MAPSVVSILAGIATVLAAFAVMAAAYYLLVFLFTLGVR